VVPRVFHAGPGRTGCAVLNGERRDFRETHGKVRPGMGWVSQSSVVRWTMGGCRLMCGLIGGCCSRTRMIRSEFGMRGVLRNMHAAAVITSFVLR
jgi:hypothetical protein